MAAICTETPRTSRQIERVEIRFGKVPLSMIVTRQKNVNLRHRKLSLSYVGQAKQTSFGTS